VLCPGLLRLGFASVRAQEWPWYLASSVLPVSTPSRLSPSPAYPLVSPARTAPRHAARPTGEGSMHGVEGAFFGLALGRQPLTLCTGLGRVALRLRALLPVQRLRRRELARAAREQVGMRQWTLRGSGYRGCEPMLSLPGGQHQAHSHGPVCMGPRIQSTTPPPPSQSPYCARTSDAN